MMKKRALLIGSSFSAAPILFRLRQRGLQVAVCGSLPSDPCHQYGDASHYIDYSNREALLALVSEERFDYIVPTCNDYSYMSGAWVAGQLGYPGFDRYDVAEKLHTKNGFRHVTQALGTPAPKAIWSKSGESLVLPDSSYPVLVKPVDSFSGRGVTKVSDADGLQLALEQAWASSRSGDAVVESFVNGELHSHSAFIQDGRIATDFFVDEFCSVYPYQVDCSNHPSRLSEGIRAGVRAAMGDLIARLELTNGLLHTQFICDGSQFWIIECMRRCPGDLYGGLIERSLGIDYTDLFVQAFVGESIQAVSSRGEPDLVGRHTISVDRERVFQSFSCDFPGNGVQIVPLKGSGERLREAPFDKLAIAFFNFRSVDDMLTETPKLKDYVRIQGLGLQQGER